MKFVHNLLISPFGGEKNGMSKPRLPELRIELLNTKNKFDTLSLGSHNFLLRKLLLFHSITLQLFISPFSVSDFHRVTKFSRGMMENFRPPIIMLAVSICWKTAMAMGAHQLI